MNKSQKSKKIRYTKLPSNFTIHTLLYEETLKKSMIDDQTDQREAENRHMIFNHYLDKNKRTEIMKNTSFEVEDVIGDILSKDSISPEQINK